MAERSLQASSEGIARAKNALIGRSLTQQGLADRLQVSRLPISNFFRGKPVSRELFCSICTELNLDWEQVAAKPNDSSDSDMALDNIYSGTTASVGRSLQLPFESIDRAKIALMRRALTQKALAEELGISRVTVVNFFTGKPVDRNLFVQICESLGFDWEEVIATSPIVVTSSRRSLSASEAGLRKAKEAFRRRGWTMEYLAGSVNCTRQSVHIFFAKKALEKRLFQAICTELDLEWGEIADLEVGTEQPDKALSIYELVQTVRDNIRDSIQLRCGIMRVLDMTQPIGLDDIYTSVNILEKITGRRRLEITELLQGISLKNFERFSLGGVCEERVPALEAVNKYPKLMILGKPGAGKTTFLKYLAIQCIGGTFQPRRIPIFITLKDFAEAANQPDLLNYLIQFFASYSITPETKAKTELFAPLWKQDLPNVLPAVEQLLMQGKLLVLLDGLDEVREPDSRRVLKQIQNFTTEFDKNQFVITCRIAAREYTFEQFTEVEIADFDEKQIASFANKWFRAKDDLVKAERFIQSLKADEPMGELATNPLLLTLLCLVFEESGSFPPNRSELYKEGLDVLLKKWDTKRNIERDQVYKRLSLNRKEDLLSQIALETFEQGNYFFKQKEVERYITQYIQNLPEASTDAEVLQLDSAAVLKSIEAQHGLLVERARGIYSFSHLVFQEYFTAKKIVSSPASQSIKNLQNLANHVTDKCWWEVFLLAVGMLPIADDLLLLMKDKTDALVASDEKLQQFLNWVNLKSLSVDVPYRPVAVRAFYFNLVRTSTFNLSLALDYALDPEHNHELNLDYKLTNALNYASSDAYNSNLNLEYGFALASEPELKQLLQKLKAQLPKQTSNYEIFRQWWHNDGQNWTQQLRAALIEYRNIGHDWQFSNEQNKLLQQYYNANHLLVDCLNSDCYVSRAVRQEIEDTLLLPTAGIGKRIPAD